MAGSTISVYLFKIFGRHKLVRVQFPSKILRGEKPKKELSQNCLNDWIHHILSLAAKRGGSKRDSENKGLKGGWDYAKKARNQVKKAGWLSYVQPLGVCWITRNKTVANSLLNSQL